MALRIDSTMLHVTVTSFALNLIWENAQMPLYAGYLGFAKHFPMCLIASIGDVALIVLTYFGTRNLKLSLFWLAALSAVLAIVIEAKSLRIGLWEYAPGMPLLPLLHVGLLPFIQLPLTALLSVKLSNSTVKYFAKTGVGKPFFNVE